MARSRRTPCLVVEDRLEVVLAEAFHDGGVAERPVDTLNADERGKGDGPSHLGAHSQHRQPPRFSQPAP